ncbi:unnamed protein product [Brassica napus]|uniref:(rape) hypothetical protein n=1 Tax=Brassica napus TaxID=3708 RepID=A0A816YHU4_BRANA|nr:unnamed protein product [Brassica napus]
MCFFFHREATNGLTDGEDDDRSYRRRTLRRQKETGETMSARKKRASKGKGKEVAEPEEGAVDERLPSRLFVTDRYPSKRHNCNSSLEYLLLV